MRHVIIPGMSGCTIFAWETKTRRLFIGTYHKLSSASKEASHRREDLVFLGNDEYAYEHGIRDESDYQNVAKLLQEGLLKKSNCARDEFE